MTNQLIYVGVISSAYNLQGLVKITSFTSEPKTICKLACIDEKGTRFICNFVKQEKQKIICRIEGINNRTEAEKILGTKLYILRSDLPVLTESEYYIEDLCGLDVINSDGAIIGKVKSVHNFGAGDIIEINFNSKIDGKRSEMYSFTKEIFPEITKDYIKFIEKSAE